MSIEISNLNSAGGDLFAGTDSFMTELQTTETTNIFGGYNQRWGRRNWNKERCATPKPTWKCKPVECKPVYCFVPTRPSC